MRTWTAASLVLAFWCGSIAHAETIQLGWDASASSGVVGYKLYYGPASASYTNQVTVGNVTNAIVTELIPGATYYFAVSSINSAGRESRYSTEISYQVPLTASISLLGLTQTYDGSTKPVSATTEPPGLLVTLTYDGAAIAPTAAGTYTVVGTVSDAEYVGSVTNILTITPATAVVTLGNLTQTFDGSPKSVSVTTLPAGLAAAVTYDGSTQAPTAVGTYTVKASVTDPNYQDSSVPQAFQITPVDANGDGLPDAWQAAYGLGAHPADWDTDGDGATDAEEYLAGTDPTNAADSLRICLVESATNGEAVSLQTVVGKVYRLERNDDFPTGTWIQVGTDVTGTGTVLQIVDPEAANLSGSVYRARIIE